MTQPNIQNSSFCGRTRREFLWETGAGFTGLALSGLLDSDFLSRQAVAADGKTKFVNPLAPKDPHFDPKATSVIFLYMYGGPSHIDTFDYKPAMKGMDGKTIDVKTFGRGGRKATGADCRDSLELQAARRLWPVGQRSVPELCHVCR